jgi:hypothetical protein
MKVTAKITKTKRKGGFYAIRCSIVHYFRDYAGRPRHKIIASFPTIRSTEVNKPDIPRKFWQRLDAEIMKLAASRKYMRHDLETIRKRFAEVVPKPTAFGSTTRPIAKVDHGAVFEKTTV